MYRSLFVFAAVLPSLWAADGAATITPVPNSGGPAVSGMRDTNRPVAFPRPISAFEIEILSVKKDDPASVAAWTLLAAQGYHVVASIPGDGGVVFYLERPIGMNGQGLIKLPTIIEQDPATADGIRVKIKHVIEERQKSASAETHAPMSTAPASTPAPAANNNK